MSKSSAFYFDLARQLLSEKCSDEILITELLFDQEFIAYLKENRLLSLVAHIQDFFLRNDFAETLYQKELTTQAAHSALIEYWQNNLLLKFNENQLPALKLKGSCLSKKLFGTNFINDSGDIDLLIKPCDYFVAKKLLKDLGFFPKRNLTPLSFKIDKLVNHSEEYAHKQTNLELDLHWYLAETYFVSPELTEHAWQELATNSAKEIAQKYEFLLLCVQSAKVQHQSLRRLFEIYTFQKRFPQIITEVEELSSRFGLQNICSTSLATANRCFETNLKFTVPIISEARFIFNSKQNNSAGLVAISKRYLLPFASDFKLKLPTFAHCLYFPIKWLRQANNILKLYSAERSKWLRKES